MEFASVFNELAGIVVFATIVGAIGLVLRQPLIVSFIAAGVLAGPSLLDLAQSTAHLDLLAEIGVALLLFVVGLKLDIHLIRTTGPVALVTGLGQIVFTSVLGFFLCLGLGMDPIVSGYVAVALTFSSTIIIVKLLSDKGEIDSLHGRVALGFLIVQDIAVVALMIVLSAIGVGAGKEGDIWDTLSVIALNGAGLVLAVTLFARYLARPLLHRLADSHELMFLFAIGLAVGLAAISGSLGFSKEMGAFMAGVALASTPFRDAIGSRLTGLRDFLLLFFFVSLGAHIDLSTIGQDLLPAIVLSLFVLIGNPLIVMAIMGAMGYRKRTGLLAGLTVAQISEFSLIFAALGMNVGHLQSDHVGLVTLIGLITIGLSTYMILYSAKLYAFLEPWLGIFERRVPFREAEVTPDASGKDFDVLLFGLGRYGSNIARHLRQQGLSVLGIDFDPEAVRHWRDAGHAAIYGDATDPDFSTALPLGDRRQWVVSAISSTTGEPLSNGDPQLTLLRALKAASYEGRMAATAQRAGDVHILKEAGADVVLLPFADAARQAVDLLTAAITDGDHRGGAGKLSNIGA